MMDDPDHSITGEDAAPTRVEARAARSSRGKRPAAEGSRQADAGAEFPPGGERYEIRELIAQGGMGEVHLAWDRVLQREVAFKTLRSDLDDATLAPRFAVEARLSGCLEHPNIVPVHDYGIGPDGRPFYTMRWIRGRSLAQLVADGRLPSAVERLDVFRKVCDAIAFAHAEGVVHRDLKPSNVMVGEFGEVLVLDWGIARVAAAESGGAPPSRAHESLADDSLSSPHTRDGVLIGTPLFMAPELLRGERDRIDPRVDVYALGVMLYRLLTNAMPFAGERGLHDARAGRFISPRSRNHEVGRELDAIVRRAMALDPTARYATAAELRRDVQAYLEGGEISAYPLGAVGRAMRWTRRNRRIVVPVAVTALFAAIILVIIGAFQARALSRSRDQALDAERLATDQAARAENAAALTNIQAGRFEDAQHALARARAKPVSPAVQAFTDLVEAFLLHEWTPPLLAWRFPDTETRHFSIVVSTDGKAIMFGTTDGRIRAMALPSGEQIVDREFDQDAASAAGFVNGHPAVALTEGHRARLVDLETNLDLVIIDGDAPIIRNIDADGGFVSVFDGGQRSLVDVETGTTRPWRLPDDATVETMSADGSVVTGSRAAPFRIPDVHYVWDGETGATLHEFRGIDRLHVDPTGRRLLVVDRSGASLYDVASGEVLHRWSGMRARNAAFDVDGARVALDHGDGMLSRWRLDPVALESEQRFRANLRGVTADGALVVAGVDGWSVLAPTEPRGGRVQLDGHPVHASASSDGVLACIASRDGRIRVFEPWTASVLATFQGAPAPTGSRACEFSPDGTRLAQGDRDGVLRIWSLTDLTMVREIVGVEMVYDIAFVDEDHVLAAFGNGDIGTWNVVTGERTATFAGGPTGPWSLDLSQDGTRVLATGRMDGDATVTVWRREGGLPLFAADDMSIAYGGKLSPSGKFVAAGTHHGSAIWWEIGSPTRTVGADHLDGVVLSVAFSNDETLVFGTSEQGVLEIWRRDGGEKVGTLPLLPADLGQLVMVPQTQTLLAIGSDQVRALDLARPKLADATTPRSEATGFVLPGAGERARQLGLHASMNGDWIVAHRWFNEALDGGAAPPALDRIRASWAAGERRTTQRLLAAAAQSGAIAPGTAALWSQACTGPISVAKPPAP